MSRKRHLTPYLSAFLPTLFAPFTAKALHFNAFADKLRTNADKGNHTMRASDFILFALLVAFASAIGSSIGSAILSVHVAPLIEVLK